MGKCLWKAMSGACIREEGVTKKCKPLSCPDGYQVELMLGIAFVLVVVIIIFSMPK
jgi:hypothetical protein